VAADEGNDLSSTDGLLLGAGFFGAIGLVLGALSGLTVQWEEVQLDQLRVQPVATVDGRFGLAASVRF
jgi:hypothetical protein